MRRPRGFAVGQQSNPTKPIDELLQIFRRQSEPKFRFDALPHHLRGSRAVELLRDEMLCLLETEVTLRHRVLDDEDRPVSSVLAADDQVVSQFYAGG